MLYEQPKSFMVVLMQGKHMHTISCENCHTPLTLQWCFCILGSEGKKAQQGGFLLKSLPAEDESCGCVFQGLPPYTLKSLAAK